MILFGLAGGLGNSLFCLPAIKALSRVDSVSLVVDCDYDATALFRRCRYVESVYGPGSRTAKADRYLTGQYVPAAFRGRNVEFCGWPRGESRYAHPEWAQIKLKATGNYEKEDCSDWIELVQELEDKPRGGFREIRPTIDFALIPCGKPGDEWARKKWAGFRQLAIRMESLGHSVRAFGQRAEIQDARLDDWWDGEVALESLPQALSRCRCVVATDSGVGHLASSLGIPTAMLFTATSPTKGQPLGPHRIIAKGCDRAPRGCQSTPLWANCESHICREISVSEVEKVALELLPKPDQKYIDLPI